jgi:hypothetical protein
VHAEFHLYSKTALAEHYEDVVATVRRKAQRAAGEPPRRHERQDLWVGAARLASVEKTPRGNHECSRANFIQRIIQKLGGFAVMAVD